MNVSDIGQTYHIHIADRVPPWQIIIVNIILNFVIVSLTHYHKENWINFLIELIRLWFDQTHQLWCQSFPTFPYKGGPLKAKIQSKCGLHLYGRLKLIYNSQQLQVNLCQKLFFLQNMARTWCVQKLFWMSETISAQVWAWSFHVLNL